MREPLTPRSYALRNLFILNESDESDDSNSNEQKRPLVKFQTAIATPVNKEDIKPVGHFLKNKLTNNKVTCEASATQTQESIFLI